MPKPKVRTRDVTLNDEDGFQIFDLLRNGRIDDWVKLIVTLKENGFKRLQIETPENRYGEPTVMLVATRPETEEEAKNWEAWMKASNEDAERRARAEYERLKKRLGE